MKKCDHFKDLILTDYVDGELNREIAQSLENHLLDCNNCRVFFREVKNSVVMPFQQARQEPVPAMLWEKIKEGIEAQHQARSPFVNLMDKFKGLVVFPRLVPVFASLIVMLLAGAATLNFIQVQQTKDKDQGQYLVALLGATSSSVPSDNSDFGTPMEHYFL